MTEFRHDSGAGENGQPVDKHYLRFRRRELTKLADEHEDLAQDRLDELAMQRQPGIVKEIIIFTLSEITGFPLMAVGVAALPDNPVVGIISGGVGLALSAYGFGRAAYRIMTRRNTPDEYVQDKLQKADNHRAEIQRITQQDIPKAPLRRYPRK